MKKEVILYYYYCDLASCNFEMTEKQLKAYGVIVTVFDHDQKEYYFCSRGHLEKYFSLDQSAKG